MFLNPSTSAPCAKLTLNISAFNGNTTKVNVGRPSPKSFGAASPTQPNTAPWNTMTTTTTQTRVGLMRPM